VEATVEPGDDFARVDVPQRAEILRTQAFQEDGSTWRVGAQQPDRAVAAPAPR
jgi:hypothetical protein